MFLSKLGHLFSYKYLGLIGARWSQTILLAKFYRSRMAMSSGIVNTWLSRNCITFSSFPLNTDVPNITLSLREISSRQSQFGGQGMKKCSCKTKCTNTRCICRKSNVLCNSRCHSSTSCNNK